VYQNLYQIQLEKRTHRSCKILEQVTGSPNESGFVCKFPPYGVLASKMKDAFREATTRIDYESSPCPVCGGVNAKQIADGKTIRREMERVWAFHARRLRHPVPLSHLTDRVIFYPAARAHITELL